MNYLAPSWQEMDNLIFQLAKRIRSNKVEFNRVVTLSKGGWPMVRPLIDYVDGTLVSSIGIKLYKGVDERATKPEVYQDIMVDIKDEDILLFDDVADTGKSLEFAVQYLKDRGVRQVVTVCLYYKPQSSIKPDYYAQKTNDWIIFPYELRETIASLVKQGKDKEELFSLFTSLNFSSEKVSYFLGLT